MIIDASGAGGDNGEKKFMNPKEYAGMRGVHVNTVLRWLREKRIEGEQPGGRRGVWLIPVKRT